MFPVDTSTYNFIEIQILFDSYPFFDTFSQQLKFTIGVLDDDQFG